MSRSLIHTIASSARVLRALVLPAVPLLVLGGAALVRPVSAETPWVQLCEQIDYGGRCEVFTADDPNLLFNFLGADRASSVRVAPGSQAALYEHPGYQGRCETFVVSDPSLSNNRLGGNTASSLRVGRGC